MPASAEFRNFTGETWTMRVSWPRSEGYAPVPLSVESEQSETPPRELSHAVKSILVVDDAQDLAMSLKILLEFAGHEVRVSYDGPSALAACRSRVPDVVLLDIGLPGINGYEVARQMRKEHGSKLLLLAMSGYGQEEDKRRAQEEGCNHHITKPVDVRTLAELMDNCRTYPCYP